MNFERTYTIHINAEQCRTILRLDLSYNFSGVIKSEINENYFQIKNLAVNTGSIFYPNLPQLVSIRLLENIEGSTAIIINSSPNAEVADNKIIVWQNSLEQLVDIVWTDIFRAAQNRYFSVSHASLQSKSSVDQSYEVASKNNHAQNITNQSAFVTSSNSPQQQSAPNKNQKKWIGILAIAVAIIIVIIIIQISDGGTNSRSKENRAISCAQSLIMDMLRDPDSMSVNDSKIIEKDNYDRYIVYLDITATNGFGGRVRNIYCMHTTWGRRYLF